MPARHWSRVWARAPWLRLLSGAMFQRSTADHGVALRISSLADSPAKTSATRESAPVSMGAEAGFGLNMLESFPKFDLNLSSLRTSGPSSREGSTESSIRLPRSGSMRNGVVSARPTLVRPISANESSSWPTPTATTCGANQGGGAGRVGPIRPSLTTLGKSWATPRASMINVCASDTNRAIQDLPRQASDWATPTSRDWKDGANPSMLVPTKSLLGRQAPRSGIDGSSFCECPRTLNPRFVEALMGWPEGWSIASIGSVSSVMEWSRKWQRSLFANSRGGSRDQARNL